MRFQTKSKEGGDNLKKIANCKFYSRKKKFYFYSYFVNTYFKYLWNISCKCKL